ncbi:N-acetylmuramoyl-L-alanine amidase [Kordia sp. SMS9]|uniref:N-acetylmuramoyl-L-alanine amidase n=1 Tax=Kordia sp. SMS9 TaxID=2282170 RepID=UPI000E0CCB0B|nr:N-acetylmuramoyl-L-alanine amidase [Kordia sp. SMS9]AXG70432.1 N-acetylmuramoyl-L-alanine amidase [Kordia sp. SMS9]
MKVAIVIGHTKFKQGAYSRDLDTTEWKFNKMVAAHLKDIATIFYYDSYNLGYTSMVKRNAKKINTGNFDLVLELHFNAAESKQANGCEALYYFKNQKGKRLADFFCNLIEKKMGRKNRGAKALFGKHQRGFAAVFYPNPTTLILEPFFGTNRSDANAFRDYKSIESYVSVIKETIKKFSYEV